ncbi:uncharacterized protein B0J16DRAFT_361247 [Fusarium flagelliforme]|uniref:Short chain dehydrogenase n=1 Tax=Fusarium flagelliforme TaxID=2675880 RepID=A0A395MI29_9HYPO|nr:uncharacterized protein B0J16DRAFT_361247 [Fusarium flagelliforme]KAH7192942.1 hypothetical protein B0J16DRAFT_361247 [Fusarium flagelliforme]RFN47430.1 hypothetical protein FIE12Z_8292 [Fusarium flagelliforme]
MAENKEIVLITGGNTGIGFETVKALFRSSKTYHILLGSRDTGKGDKAVAELEEEFPNAKSSVDVVQIDIVEDQGISHLFETVKSKFGRIDILINNAGANFESFRENDGADPSTARLLFNRTYNVNVASTQVFTATFIPLLLSSPSPRIIFLTSGLSTLHGAHDSFLMKLSGSIPKGWPKSGIPTAVAYRSAKTALNMVMLSWYHLLKDEGVRVWSVSPGFLATGLGGNPELLKKAGAGDPKTGGDLILKVVEGEKDADVGKVVGQNGLQEW